MPGYWEELERPGPDAVTVAGTELRAGSRVRLHPRPGADAFDLILAGHSAVVEAVEHDVDGTTKLAVVIEDDPGRDLGFARQPGHRFFFAPEEVEYLGPGPAPDDDAKPLRILVAGIGNVFLGDDGFGVALADRLWRRALPAGVEVVDYGTRGMDLAFAMQDGYDAVVLLDASPRGQAPGTLYVLEPEQDRDGQDGAGDDGAGQDGAAQATVDAHGMDPVKVLDLVRSFGSEPPRTYVVACEPQTRMSAEDADVVAALSEPVLAALDPAVTLVEQLLDDITHNSQETPE